jgi:hypothetical protein
MTKNNTSNHNLAPIGKMPKFSEGSWSLCSDD